MNAPRIALDQRRATESGFELRTYTNPR
jgi:hypothetical protein